MTEEINIPPEQPRNKKTMLYIVIGITVFCCACCGLALTFQLILQNSDFTLVNIFPHFYSL